LGNEYLYQTLASRNIETLLRHACERTTILTSCPHCFNSLANEYPQLGGHFRVVHHAAYLNGLLAEGRLRLASPGGATSATLHDSCYLARYNDIIAEPRDVLSAIPGLDLREMAKSGRNTFCCGAGGGRMWMEETRGTRVNTERTRQALDTGASTIVTECPFCLTLIRDGLAEAGKAASVVASADLAELVVEHMLAEETATAKIEADQSPRVVDEPGSVDGVLVGDGPL
jgi:Fe-S oxidoreductase